MARFILKLPKFTSRPRDVVVLPDHRFFVRSVGLTDEAEAGSRREQLELALEGMSPFPVSQMLWGYWSKPGVSRALVYAAYRKRFTAEEIEPWSDAEWVGPQLAAGVVEDAPAAATTWLIAGQDELTAVHFGDESGVPTMVRSVRWDEETSDADRARAREDLLRACGGSKTIVDLAAAAVRAGLPGSDELVVEQGDHSRRISLERVEPLDVRDQDELMARRRARIRDRWMWRGLVAAVIAIGLAGVAELTVRGTAYWRDALHRQVQAQAPVVNEIETADRLANRIDELRTKRLRPFEMIAIADGPRPESIIFLRTAATGLYSLEIEAETNDAPAINAYVSALMALAQTEAVEILNLDQRGSRSTVRVLVRFTTDAFRVAATPEESA